VGNPIKPKVTKGARKKVPKKVFKPNQFGEENKNQAPQRNYQAVVIRD